jgi:UDP-glucuronate decarboxylase
MIRWITDRLGTAAWDTVAETAGITRLDVRDLVDRGGNAVAVVRGKLEAALNCLRRGERVVICCDYGRSRSNAVAAGVLAAHEGVALAQAIRRVVAATGETAMRIEVLSAVRAALPGECPVRPAGPGERRVLITGGSGFIGSALVADLGGRCRVLAPGHQEIDLLHGSVPLDLLVREQGVDTLVHLANPRVYSTNESLGASLVMLKNVLDVCSENGIFLVYLSSWELYSGYRAREIVADEALAPRPGGTYGQTKLLCESLLEEFRLSRGLSCTILRSSPVYGPGGERPKFIWNFLHKALCGADIVAHKYLNGYPTLDLLHVDDLRAAVRAAVERRVSGTFQVGTGVGTSTTEIARHLVSWLGSRSRLRHHEMNRYTANVLMDASRARAVLGWEPTVGVLDGLRRMLQVDQSPGSTANGSAENLRGLP